MKSISTTKTACFLFLTLIPSVFAHASNAQHVEQNTLIPKVFDAWVKTTVPGGTVSAAYMKIKSGAALKLVKAESPAAGIVEIHSMKMTDGVMEMKALEALHVPADKLLDLKPGGVHIMLMKVRRPINKGDKIPLILTFESAGKKPVVVKLDVAARENSSDAHNH